MTIHGCFRFSAFGSLVASLFVLAGCSNLLFFPSPELDVRPAMLVNPVEEVAVPSSSGGFLHGWMLHPAEAPRAVIVFFHGNAENLSTHVASISWLPRYGYAALIVDYRGFGNSRGSASLSNATTDCQDAIRFAASYKGYETLPLVVFGQSIGGGLAPYAVSTVQETTPVTLLILDSAVAGFRRIAREKLWSSVILAPLAYPLGFLIERDYDAEDWLPKVTAPVVVVHGTADPIVPLEHGMALYRAASPPAYSIIVEGASHIGGLLQPCARKKLLALLDISTLSAKFGLRASSSALLMRHALSRTESMCAGYFAPSTARLIVRRRAGMPNYIGGG